MGKDPWRDPDPRPGDFDVEIEAMGPAEIQLHPGKPDAGLIRLPDGMDAGDVDRLAALAAKRGKSVGEVLVELVRDA